MIYAEINKIYQKLYHEEVATKLFKIFKYEEKFARYIENSLYGKKCIMIFDEISYMYRKLKAEADKESVGKDNGLIKILENYESTVFGDRFQILMPQWRQQNQKTKLVYRQKSERN